MLISLERVQKYTFWQKPKNFQRCFFAVTSIYFFAGTINKRESVI